MKIGGRYRVQDIDLRRWQAFAREARVDEAALLTRAAVMAAAIPDEFATLRKQAAREGVRHPVLERLQTVLAQQCVRCAHRLR